jgi:hypothetical protein
MEELSAMMSINEYRRELPRSMATLVPARDEGDAAIKELRERFSQEPHNMGIFHTAPTVAGSLGWLSRGHPE